MRILILLLLFTSMISKSTGPETCPVRPQIVEYIAIQEGFYSENSLPRRLHNPGSLKYAGQFNAMRGVMDFAEFSSDEAGWAALERDIFSKLDRNIPLKIAWDYLD